MNINTPRVSRSLLSVAVLALVAVPTLLCLGGCPDAAEFGRKVGGAVKKTQYDARDFVNGVSEGYRNR